MTIELPEHLRTGPLAEAAARALIDAQSMSAASNSVPRISLRGREFRLVEGGEELAKFHGSLDVIILGVEPGPGKMIKTFYEKGYQQGAKEPPTCSSDDGVAPSAWVTNKQSPTCQSCPKNVFGSATNPTTGKQTKACRDSKRIWVKVADGNVLNNKPFEVKPFAERTMYGINVTVSSLKAFSEYGNMLQGLGQGPAVCVTTLVMVDSEFPQMEFKLKAWLDAETAPLSLQAAEKRPWKVFTNAGLALAGPDGGSRPGLPTSLPGVPAHLKQAAAEPQGTQTVVDAAAPTEPAKPAVSNEQIDDAVGKW